MVEQNPYEMKRRRFLREMAKPADTPFFKAMLFGAALGKFKDTPLSWARMAVALAEVSTFQSQNPDQNGNLLNLEELRQQVKTPVRRLRVALDLLMVVGEIKGDRRNGKV